MFHGKFGYGTIAAIEGNKLEIDFEHAGRKKVLDSFVALLSRSAYVRFRPETDISVSGCGLLARLC